MYKISKFKKLSLAVATLMVGLALVPSLALAVDCTSNSSCTVAGEVCVGYVAAVGTTPEVKGTCLKDTFGLSGINNTGLGKAGLLVTASKIINVALSLLGLIAVVIVLAGGFKWMTAGGNEEKTTEARKMIFAGIIGLAIILSAWSITLFVFTQLQKATGSGTVPNSLQVD
ncbi:MAG: pilin [Patescibacteria group bacterium]